MKRVEAVRQVAQALAPEDLVVSCNGMISRELCTVADRPEHFYMIGSMGLASSIGLGLALQRPARTVVVLDGDGNVLMNMGALGNVASAAPRNFYHVVLDNGVHGSTGGQRTISAMVQLEQVAAACGYVSAVRVSDAAGLAAALRAQRQAPGPSLVLVQVEPVSNVEGIGRIDLAPPALADRFRAAALAQVGA